MSSQSSIDCSNRMDCLWVSMPESINMNNYRDIEREIGQKISDGEHKVVIDLQLTGHLYSSGLGLLIRIRKKVAEYEGSLYLVNVSKRLRHLFEMAQLHKIFDIYATDIEFEVSCDDVWSKKETNDNIEFIFIRQEEGGICRINLSGQMTTMKDLSPFKGKIYSDAIKYFVFDLTGLDIIDSYGLELLTNEIVNIKEHEGVCVAYGVNTNISEMFTLLSLNEYIICYDDEQNAMKSIGKG